ncbi:nuclear hormone receptor HR96-like [Oppia nitens]|uniref:nuclear hormone receptor HR96-like n=1 Tax=Oppia nitens TaxID=1686743 RepID=UPI0023DA5404|nr:nuclear hormone receptor HR96-like [Oppia nitens]
MVNKFCVVCGDKATGYNFNALTCESCKAFFRRNALKQIPRCKFQSNCVIDLVMRRMCAACRLKKCMDCGMKKEWIWNDEAKESRRMKIESNRNKRTFDEMRDTDIETHQRPAKQQMVIDPTYQYELTRFSALIYQKAVELELSVIPIARPVNDFTQTYNELECNRLNELFNATKLIESQSTAAASKTLTKDDIIYALDSKCVQEIRNIIRLSKMLIGFNSINKQDQEKLIKRGCIQIYTMRSVTYYDNNLESWNIKLDQRNTVMLRLDDVRNSHTMYSQFKDYLKRFKYELDNDYGILDLMTAIVLFNPDYDDLVDKELIKQEQKIYMYLLKRYLHRKYHTTCEANGKFLNLLNTLVDLQYLENKVQQDFQIRHTMMPSMAPNIGNDSNKQWDNCPERLTVS